MQQPNDTRNLLANGVGPSRGARTRWLGCDAQYLPADAPIRCPSATIGHLDAHEEVLEISVEEESPIIELRAESLEAVHVADQPGGPGFGVKSRRGERLMSEDGGTRSLLVRLEPMGRDRIAWR